MAKQVLIVFGVCLAGLVLSGLSPLPVPGSVLAMLGLLALLCLGWVKEKSIAGLCGFFQDNMAFFFIPAGVGVIENLDFLKTSGLALAAVCVIGTLITFAAAGFTVKAVLAVQEKRRARK